MKFNFKYYAIMLIMAVLFLFSLLYCENNTSPTNIGTPQPTPVDPEVAIVGSWDCPPRLSITEESDNEYINVFNSDYTFEFKSYKPSSTYPYFIEKGNYSFEEDGVLKVSYTHSGYSDISFEDAQEKVEQLSESYYYVKYFYVDNYIFQDQGVFFRINAGQSLVGTWNYISANETVQTSIDLTVTTSKYTEEYYRYYFETETTEKEGSITYDYSISNNILTLNGAYEGEVITKKYPYRLVNNYNTLVLNPCTRVE